MNGLLYLYKRLFINRFRKAIRKPITYFFTAFILLYGIFLLYSFNLFISDFKLDNQQSMAVIMSVLPIFLLPSNFIAYAKRKGLLFRKSDVHFIFPAPVNPKQILLFVGIKNLLINTIMAILLVVMGLLFFHANIVAVFLYAFAFFVLENVLEASMIILCYGNEKLSNGFFKVLSVICYGLLLVFIVAAILIFMEQGFTFRAFTYYLTHPIVQLVPVVGWNVALIHLILIGPNLLYVICSILFVVTAGILFVIAYRSKCVGEYYEDAAKFADDYAEARAKQKKGVVDWSFGRKKKFKNATVEYKGSKAKAIFYRQLLEYKKSKFFIFGLQTLISLAVGIGIAVLVVLNPNDELLEGPNKIFLIPGVMAYIVFICSGYATKWSKELENPYTFLIPDNCFRKLWYATVIEHIRALIDGILIAVPGAIVMRLTPLQTILIIIVYVCLMANRLYYFMVADILVGRVLGSIGRNIFKVFIQAVAIGIAAIGAVVVGFLLSVEAGFFVMILLTCVLTFLGVLFAATAFEKMEVME